MWLLAFTERFKGGAVIVQRGLRGISFGEAGEAPLRSVLGAPLTRRRDEEAGEPACGRQEASVRLTRRHAAGEAAQRKTAGAAICGRREARRNETGANPTLRKGSEGRGTLKGGRKSHGASASDVIRAL